MSGSVQTLARVLERADVFVDGDWVESKDQDPNGDVRLIQLADIGDGYYIDKSNRFLTSDTAKRLKCTFLKSGDIIVARMPDPIGRACIFPGDSKPCVTVVDVCVIRVNEAEICARWLMHTLNAPLVRNQIAGYATGTTRSRISRGNLSKIELTVPSLPEQRRIAAILDKADALRTKRREALAQLDRLAQSIFIEMFGDPEAPTGKYPQTTLGELCRRVTDGTHQSPTWVSEGVPFLFISNIVNGKINFDTDKYISRETYEDLTRRCPIEKGDVLYTTVGSYGNSAVVSGDEVFCFQRHIAHIKPDPTKLDSVFCAAMIESPGVRRQVDKVARGVAQKTVNLSDLKALKVLAPDLSVQHLFTQKIANIQRLKDLQLMGLAQSDDLFRAIQHHAFRGEL